MRYLVQRRIASFRTGAVLIALASIVAGVSEVKAAVNTLKHLHCELSKAPTSANLAASEFVLTLHNRGKDSMLLLRRNTPLEPMLSDHLQVVRNGKRLEYIGPVAKRAVPTLEEYVRLAAGERIEYRFDISRGYDISASGRYRIAWNGEFMDARLGNDTPNPENPTLHRVSCKALRFTR